MKTKAIGSVVLLLCSMTLIGQSKKEQDQQAIKSMCGCFEVGFNFAETFNYSKDSTYVPSKVKHDKGLEWVQIVEDKDNKIVMQHLLIVGNPSEPTVIKHWRQDWLYENTNFYMFYKDNTWRFNVLKSEDVQGQWTQKVYQVDDSPRYEGTATWTHVDGISRWKNTTDAPLPRREYTKRKDYNVTIRGNEHIIKNSGWVHNQDNLKVIRKNAVDDIILAEEKGVNNYVKVADIRCKAAQEWWVANKEAWELVRQNWNSVFSKNKNLVLQAKVSGRPLYSYLFADDFSNSEEEINETIDNFIISK
ncbi:DUF6607 family protein [Ascidiimonas sp. W6]|uniref:DUF6607 family protein n=1 Tax=Ascidiimonas meishanensis TaxID=3128903 RepID=UPI0030EC0400